ncbi:MAG TPA: phospho-N-acetylmuramoyl-pentapeptide-transferase [Candidatus Baltobacteraceae bacterium]|nr:phospho-N-acetylmuramoyl-pentapeptide-transferase [Candidatus Baltobacteraceae bacterium]
MKYAAAVAGLGLIDFVMGFVLAVIACAIELPVLRRMQFRQHAYEDAPQTHQIKSGTPTMGGIAFVVALVPLLATFGNPFAIGLFFLVAACAAIGFVDDYTAIRRGKNAGLRARTKYLLTALAAAFFLWWIGQWSTTATDVLFRMPGFTLTCPHWLWFVLGILAVSGTIHAVNLTDGLDGLATGAIIPPLLAFYAIVAVFPLSFLPTVFASAAIVTVQTAAALGIGACAGFLLFNRHPAKMFMGDTGSLALGALLSGIAILSGEMLLLVLVGGVFVIEALSVIIQVLYFKRTGGKRVFLMSPLHHHFELAGWPETQVTSRFWLASILLSGLGLAVVR